MGHIAKMSPKFSIIVPVYNKAPYIRKALDSIVSQTFRDWELIVVDDGSTDNSLQVVNEYIRDVLCMMSNVSVKIKVISQANAGVATARNRGVKESKGECVAFLDADDWWEKDFLEEMDKLIMDYPDAGLYGCDYYYLKNGRKKIFPKNVEGYIDYCRVYADCGVMPIHPSGAIIPRKVFDEIGGFNPQIKMGEDFILFMQIVLKYKVAFLNKQLVTFNQDADPQWRAITKLHKPENHMLFNFAPLEEEINRSHVNSFTPSLVTSYKSMIDMLRVNSLLPYWLSDNYHDAAAEELKKVDWTLQPSSIVRQYKMPIWLLRMKRNMLQKGSYVKQKIRKLI